jgi:hypothetical protein
VLQVLAESGLVYRTAGSSAALGTDEVGSGSGRASRTPPMRSVFGPCLRIILWSWI